MHASARQPAKAAPQPSRDKAARAPDKRAGAKEGWSQLSQQTPAVQAAPAQVLRRAPLLIQRSPGSPAGGCGICFGSPALAGIEAHAVIQAGFELVYGHAVFSEFLVPSPTDENGRLDLMVPIADGFAIGEIKPDNPDGWINGELDLIWYAQQLEPFGFEVERMILPPPVEGLPFIDPLAPQCQQRLYVNAPVAGVYTYFCEPDFKVLRPRCRCGPPPVPVPRPQEQEERKRIPVTPRLEPVPIIDRVQQWIREVVQSGEDAQEAARRFIQQNPDFLPFVAALLITAGILLLIATVVEDVLTLGAGIADDPASVAAAIALFVIAAEMIGSGGAEGSAPPEHIQAKLTVGAPNDPLEREADQVADTVVRRSAAKVSGRTPLRAQRVCAACASGAKCAHCAEEEEQLHRKPAGIQHLARPANQFALRASSAASVPDVSPQLSSSIEQMRGRGAPLPANVRSGLEPEFGVDLSRVRVHTDASAASAAQQLDARAFTLGADVFFGAGQYSPSGDGQRLLAHELTHVVQQGGAPAALQRKEQTDRFLTFDSAQQDFNDTTTIGDLAIALLRATPTYEKIMTDLVKVFKIVYPKKEVKATLYQRPVEGRVEGEAGICKNCDQSCESSGIETMPEDFLLYADLSMLGWSEGLAKPKGFEVKNKKSPAVATASIMLHELLHLWFYQVRCVYQWKHKNFDEGQMPEMPSGHETDTEWTEEGKKETIYYDPLFAKMWQTGHREIEAAYAELAKKKQQEKADVGTPKPTETPATPEKKGIGIQRAPQRDNSVIQRSACAHDGKGTMCSGSGVWRLIDESGPSPVTMLFALDNIIVSSMRRTFGGTWAAQVQSPPNPRKGGTDRGFIDGLKVDESSGLRVEVVEIKSRSELGGGCLKASREADGYVAVLQAIANDVVDISSKLASRGGFRVPSDDKLSAADRRFLTEVGVDLTNPATLLAWRFYNGLQNRLNKTFATAFASMTAAVNTDGNSGQDYEAGFPVIIRCRNGEDGLRHLIFQVNKQGGVSYGCKDKCPQKRRKPKEKPLETQPVVSPEYRLENPWEEDYEYDEPEPVPPEGIPVTDILIVAAASAAAIKMLHDAAQLTKNQKELEILAKEAQRHIDILRRNGAGKLAEKYNASNFNKFGTRGYDKVLKEGADNIDDIARKIPPGEIARRLGPKTAEKIARFGGRAMIVVTVVMTAKDAHALARNLEAGATLELGLGLDETTLSGDTHVSQPEDKEKAKSKTSGDVEMEDTVIDIDVKSMPDLTGDADIETENVKITGALGSLAGPATINLRVKMKDTTIVLKQTGTLSGDHLVLEGDVSGSTIEIDLPPGTVTQAGGEGKPIELKGAKLKVTKTAAAKGTEAGETPGGDQESGIASKTRKEMIAELRADKSLAPILEKVSTRKGEVPLPDEFMRRLLALKPKLDRHPELLPEILAGLQKSDQASDPIEDIIVPIEKLLETTEKAIDDKLDGATESFDEGGPQATRTVDFDAIFEEVIIPKEFGIDPEITSPPKNYDVIATWSISSGSTKLTYEIPLRLTRIRVLKPAPTEFVWAGEYDAAPAEGLVLSSLGDRPVRFVSRTKRVVIFGLYKQVSE